VGVWYGNTIKMKRETRAKEREAIVEATHGKVGRSIAILMALTFSKHFYLVHTYGLTVQQAQLHLFIFLAAVAAGTVIGGPIGDRIGARRVIWWSILG